MSGPQLTEFQQRTASYVVRRFWEDEQPAMRFLVADEVGLGKTIIARDVIDRTLARFGRRRFDIVYLCSNSVIAGQNLDKLKKGGGTKAKATRLTLLAIDAVGQGRVRYFAITPDTSFRLSRNTGTVRERALIFQTLRSRIRPAGFEALLRMDVRSWDDELARIHDARPDRKILRAFRDDVVADPALKQRIRDLAGEAWPAPAAKEFKARRKRLIGELRKRLANAGADMLARTGLVIVDEFQRFSNLLHGNEDAPSNEQLLARRILSDQIADRRVLLLSATPYRLPGMTSAAGESPYEDFVGLMRFLAGEAEAAQLKNALAGFSRALRTRPPLEAEVEAARNAAQTILRRVMARTERASFTADPDALINPDISSLESEEEDLRGAIAARRISRRLKVADPIEYWKSAPFCLEFMRDYQLRKAVSAEACPKGDRRYVATEAAKGGLLLDLKLMRRFGAPKISSARMRHLLAASLPEGTERLLWVPPSMPYLCPAGPFTFASSAVKRLIFTEWRLAPDAISSLISYEAERRLHTDFESRRARKRKAKTAPDRRHESFGASSELLRLGRRARDGTEVGLVHTTLALLVPATELGKIVDPLMRAIERGEPVPADETLRGAIKVVTERLRTLPAGPAGKRVDERWYWAAPLLMDGKGPVKAWLAEKDPFLFGKGSRLDGEPMRRAIDGIFDNTEPLGARPADLAAVLAEFAIGSPGICAMRALRRFFPEPAQDSLTRRSAFQIARGLQSLFNQHDAMVAVQLLYPRRAAYWRQAVRYCIDGNLQALLDEQLHGDLEALAMSGKTLAEKIEGASKPLYDALAIRRASLDVTGLDRRRRRRESPNASGGLRFRSRHALRFAEIKESDGQVSRLDHVRGAFNSPFRPFVLASTSVGQEGLDFHPWCHIVVHWNLPRSPVELEQREGRVHRYKGHAVRANLARGLGLKRLCEEGMGGLTDPWERMFRLAHNGDTGNSLSPCWMFDGCEAPIKVRRVVPLLQLSREEDAWPHLLRRLATYRLVMGLPRQEELLMALEGNGLTAEQARAWRIDLRPDLGAG